MSRPVVGALLLVAVLTAGCAGLFGGETQERDAEAVTPAPVPEPEPELAPGIREYGVVDPGRLVATNDRLLNGTSYRFARTVVIENGSDRFRVTRRQRLRSDGVAIGRLRARGGEPVGSSVRNWTRYREGNTVHARTTLADGSRITNRLAARGVGSFAVGRDLPRRVLDRAELVVTDDGGRRVVLQSVAPFSLDSIDTPVLTDPPRNASARLVVTERGLIRALTLRYTASIGSRTVRVRITQRVSGVGNTTVERPSWVPTA